MQVLRTSVLTLPPGEAGTLPALCRGAPAQGGFQVVLLNPAASSLPKLMGVYLMPACEVSTT